VVQRVIGLETIREVEIKKALVLSYCILTKAEVTVNSSKSCLNLEGDEEPVNLD